MERSCRHVCLLGRNERSVRDAPYADGTVEIWTHGPMQDAVPRVTRYFEMHTREDLRLWGSWDPRGLDYEAWLTRPRPAQQPMYLMHPEQFPDVSLVRPYPREDIIREFGTWFTSTIAWMFALALYEGVARISVYGVELATDGEHAEELPCAAYFVGLARGRGVQVDIAPTATFCKARAFYGWNQPTPDAHLFTQHGRIRGMGEPTPEVRQEQDRRHAFIQKYLRERHAAWYDPAGPTITDDVQRSA